MLESQTIEHCGILSVVSDPVSSSVFLRAVVHQSASNTMSPWQLGASVLRLAV